MYACNYILDTETNKIVETISDTEQQETRIIMWNRNKVTRMKTITAIDANGQQHIYTVRPSEVGKHVNILKRRGLFNINVAAA